MICLCKTCNKALNRKPFRIKKYKNQFCNFKCKSKYFNNLRHTKIPKKELSKLYLKNKFTTRMLYKYFKCNHRVILELLKEYKIPIRHGHDAIKTQWNNNPSRKNQQSILFSKNISTFFRKNPSKTENLFIKRLNELNIKFLFQHPINNYILDFFIPDKNINIELDGNDHNLKKKKILDHHRDKFLKNLNIKIIRINKEQIANFIL